ncbi:MAG: carboxypeptidase regulatory-like domain-containing protein [Bryobacterales bacterium]|nr:carboxypeptidase regulatory-like domain-containing protein [Bryobacterales bacterium]
MRWGIVLLLALAAAVAQDVPKGVIAGTLLDEVTGEPVRRAGVVLSSQRATKPMQPIVVLTEADGRFRFERLEPGGYFVRAERAGYLDADSRNGEAHLQLAPGGEKTGLTIKLTPQGVITGRVFDEEGDAVEGAGIRLFQRRKVAGIFRWRALMTGATNDRGEYRLTKLPSGEFAVAATHTDPLDRIRSRTQALSRIYTTTYYPNAAELGSAQAVLVEKGRETAGIDLRLSRQPAFRVRVRVEGVSAEMLPQTAVRLLARDAVGGDGSRNFRTIRVEPGVHEFPGVLSGSWMVYAQTSAQSAERLVGATPIVVTTADLLDVVVRVGSSPQLTGRFVFEGTPAAKVNWQRFHVALATEEGYSYEPTRAAVTEDGAFTLSYFPPGRYRIEVYGPSPAKAYVASIRVGTEECFGKEIDLTNGQPGPVKIVYRNGAAVVTGRVEGDLGRTPGELGRVVLVPVEAHLRRPAHMSSEGVQLDGSFTLGHVRPGEYLVCHMQGDHRTLAEEGEPPKESLDAAVRLKVEPNGTHTVTVKAAKAAQN